MGASKRVRQIVVVVGLVVSSALLYKFQDVLPVFVLALFLAYILTPLVVWMSSKKIHDRQMPRGISIIIIYLMLLSTITFGGAYFIINLSNELKHLIKDIPSYGEKVTKRWVPTISGGIQN
ncbi:AI-2E family transporter, partial [bacterium]|nr:AI-2E family transporter [bacterium]